MPMRYANEADVLRQLSLDPANADDGAAIEEAVRIENGICANLDSRMGRSFGVPTVETVRINGVGQSVLLLPYPMREVQSVAVDGVPLASDAWEPWFVLRGEGATALRLTDLWAIWYGDIVVTGIPNDAPLSTTPIPVDIQQAATFATIRQIRRYKASPTDVVGPDGQVITLPSPWNDPAVKEAIRAHRAYRRKVSV
ncbi:MAG: hypothetical protein M3440_09150 [Chloroflexota bacterium]|nr:hypothetical protein [Chloroflexota bacterium]